MTINELRELAGLSQSAFAEKYHLNKYTLQGWEQGQRECPEAILELVKDAMGFYNRNDEGVHDLDFWMHYDEYDTQYSILRKEGFHPDKRGWLIRNNKVWFSDMGAFVERQVDEFVENITDPSYYDPETDDINEMKKEYTCGFDSFLELRNAIRHGDTIYRDFTYVGMFNPNEDLNLENEELDFDIPYVLEITE